MATADVLNDPELLATEWDLSPLVDGDEQAGVQRQLDEALARAGAFATAYSGMQQANARGGVRIEHFAGDKQPTRFAQTDGRNDVG